MLLYETFKEKCFFEDIGYYDSSGIVVYEETKNGQEMLLSVSDISTDEAFVTRLSDKMTRNQLSVIHFFDVLEDIL